MRWSTGPALKPLVRAVTLGVTLILIASACSSNNPALETASDSRFCQVLDAFPAEADNVAPDQAAEALAELRDALPPGAPAEVRGPLTAIAEMAELSERADGSTDLSSEDSARMSEALEVLDRSNTDFFNGWLTGTCPAVVAAAGNPFQLGGGSSGGSSQTTQVESAAAPTPVATATPTPVPVVTTVIGENGQAGRFRDRQMIVEKVTSTNATYESFFGDADEADEAQHVIVEMFTQTGSVSGGIPLDGLRLESPDGRSIAADEMFDVNGSRRSRIDLEARDSADFFVGFTLPEAVDVFDGWTMYYGSPEVIAEPFPLVGTIAAVYPIVLDPPASPVEFLGRAANFGFCDDTFTLEILTAVLDIEGQAFDLDRSAPNRRFLNTAVEIANIREEASEDCRPPQDNQVWGYGWRLLADGVPQGYEASSYPSGQMAPDDRVQATFRFDFPADVSQLELVDEAGNIMASWDVDIPAAPGEDGYEPS